MTQCCHLRGSVYHYSGFVNLTFRDKLARSSSASALLKKNTLQYESECWLQLSFGSQLDSTAVNEFQTLQKAMRRKRNSFVVVVNLTPPICGSTRGRNVSFVQCQRYFTFQPAFTDKHKASKCVSSPIYITDKQL